MAKLILGGLEATEGEYANIRKPFLVSSGDKSRSGNRNIRLLSLDELIILYPFDGKGKFLKFSIKIPEEFANLFEDLVNLARDGKVSYGVVISLKRCLVAHISIPLGLWLKHKRKNSKPFGNNIASIDLNSDRLNLVVIT